MTADTRARRFRRKDRRRPKCNVFMNPAQMLPVESAHLLGAWAREVAARYRHCRHFFFVGKRYQDLEGHPQGGIADFATLQRLLRVFPGFDKET